MNFIETKQIELKKEYSDSILKTISAFANYEGGKVIIGIDEMKKDIVGVLDYISLKLKIENKINDLIKPRPRYSIKVLSYEKKELLEIYVYSGVNTPYLYKGIAYQRRDTSTIPVDQMSLVELSLKGKNISYDQLEVEEADLNFSILEEKLKAIKPIANFNNDILITMGLYTNNSYNIAASLLADDNNLITLGVDIVRFGNTISEFIDRKTIIGKSILSQYDEAMEMFIKYYPEIEIVEGLKRVKKQPIPYEAFREAVANAIAHRDYLINSLIKIEMYNNRIEITSPGGLPSGLTEENYLNDNLSIPRNTIISQVLYTLGIIEKFGTGIRRINEAYFRHEKTPAYIIEDTFIKVILPNNLFDDSDMNAESRIMNLIDIKVEITRQEVESLLGFNKTKVIEILKTLIENKMIKQFGVGKNTKYKKI